MLDRNIAANMSWGFLVVVGVNWIVAVGSALAFYLKKRGGGRL